MENIFSYENLQVDLAIHHIVNLEYGGSGEERPCNLL